MKRQVVQRIKGTVCSDWGNECWEFRLQSGQRWDYIREERVVYRSGVAVGSGIMCLGDAVLYAQGFEVGQSELIRFQHLACKTYKDRHPDGGTVEEMRELIRGIWP